jgi:hypothetical protein
VGWGNCRVKGLKNLDFSGFELVDSPVALCVLLYSLNGTTWTAVGNSTFGTSASGTSRILGVAYGGGRWVAVGDNDMMAYSDD